MYLYPEHLKAKATLFFWELRDVFVLGILSLASVFIVAQTGWLLPLVGTGVYGFLTIRIEGTHIAMFLSYAGKYFLWQQQHFEGRG